MPVLWTLELMLDWAKKNGKKVDQENFNTLMKEWIKEVNKPFEEEEKAQKQASFFMVQNFEQGLIQQSFGVLKQFTVFQLYCVTQT